MLKVLLLSISLFSFTFATVQEDLLQDIKLLIEQNGKKIEQNGKKIEQNGKRIEQNAANIKTMQAQVSYVQTLLSIVLGGVIAIPFFTIYLQRKDDKYIEKETRQNSEMVSKLFIALKELSEDDPKIQRSLRVAGII
jgi:beta-lactamase regulating signal transducer with metallopeptidase domain